MKPSVHQVRVSLNPSNRKTGVEPIPVVFFVLGILLAASLMQGVLA